MYNNGGGALNENKYTEAFLKAVFVLLLVFALLGEWKQINSVLGGIPKVICVGAICIGVAYAFVRPNMKCVKAILPPTFVYLSLIALLMLWSLAIWIMNFTGSSSVMRGGSKMLFQTISIMTAVSAVYMFGIRSVDLFALGLCITNGLIMLFEIPNYGLGESFNSLFNCVIKFGDAVGYARALEIHDLTFVFGQLVLYYAIFAPRESAKDKRRRRNYLLACTFFFAVGMKRIAIPALVLFIFVGALLKKRPKKTLFFIISGICAIVFFLFFIYCVRNGTLSRICADFGIDMMGRDYLWRLANDYYSFSPTYMGKGFEFVDTIVTQWYNDGIIKLALMFHNDILKVFVEMGFPGFIIWSAVQYIAFPIFFSKYADSQTAALYIAELGYMTVTYLTDNTAFYFWSTMGLKLIVLAYAVYKRNSIQNNIPAWRALQKDEIRANMAKLLSEE